MGSIFRFKKFEVDQSYCAMKINTDGVILGAIASADDGLDTSKSLRCLDIGTGTGVIAMMLAQRFQGALVDAVEIDEQAAVTAQRNFDNSPFAGHLNVHQTDISLFNIDRRYDLIVSNPPYFVNDLKNPEEKKRLARHADERFFEGLVIKGAQLLAEQGLMWLILPVKQADFVVERGLLHGLYLQREISISSDASKPVIRKVIALSKVEHHLKQDRFYIYQSEGVYTDAYKFLLKDFFLAF